MDVLAPWPRSWGTAELADGFVALPGGLGTLEEFAEVLTWSQLGVHHKPCGLLNVANFYTPLLAFLDHAVEERFVRAEHRALALSSTSSAAPLDDMAQWVPPTVEKWIDRPSQR